MAYGETVGQLTCECGKAVPIKEGKNGSLSGTCPGCGAITWRKTVASVAAMRAKLATPAPAAPGAPAPGKSGLGKKLADALDMSKVFDE